MTEDTTDVEHDASPVGRGSGWPPDLLTTTLGTRLDRAGRLLARRHLSEFPWSGPLLTALGRVEALSHVHGSRFDRWEVSAESPMGERPTVLGRRREPGSQSGQPTSKHSTGPAGRGSQTPTQAPPTSPPEAGTSGGRPLDPDVRARLRPMVGTAADALRVRTGPDADATARAHRADAVTTGRDVQFRSGRYTPRSHDGFALLVHEATHVERLLGGRVSHHGPNDPAAEERGAQLRERQALRAGPVPARGSGPAGGRTRAELAAPSASGVPAHGPVRTAPSDRDTRRLSADIDLDGLRRSLIDDVMRQLRTEFERGG